MPKQPYKQYWFSRRAVERLIGEIRPNIAYHIKRLEELGEITPQMRKHIPRLRKEGNRMVYRKMDFFDIFALRSIAQTYDTPRATSVEERCDEIISKNNDADFENVEFVTID